jgi:hypothetical protein
MCFIAGCLMYDKIHNNTAHKRHRVHRVYIFHAEQKSVTIKSVTSPVTLTFNVKE